MSRFVAFVWPAADTTLGARIRSVSLRLRSAPTKWALALETSQLLVLCRQSSTTPRSRTYRLRGPPSGVILGQLFPKTLVRDEAPPEVDLDEAASRQICETRCQSLTQLYWGRYVAFVHDEARNASYVARDPSGGLPCFFARWGNATVFFNDVRDVLDLGIGIGAFSIRWQYVIAFLRQSHLQIPDCGVNEISELQAGELIEVNATDAKRRFLWNPATFADDQVIETFDGACRAVEATAKTCIGAWASGYERIVHRLSGGLDSTVVLSCLAQAPRRPHIVCENQFSPAAPEGDERSFARMVAECAGCPLVETELRPEAAKFERLLEMPVTSKPSAALISFQHDYMGAFIAQHAAQAVTTGQGGDQVFFRSFDGLHAADFAIRHGLRPELLRLVANDAHLTGRSFWSVLRAAISHGLLGKPVDCSEQFMERGLFLSESALRSVPTHYVMHDWLVDAARLPPAKMLHVFGIVDLLFFQQPNVTSHHVDAPLLLASQPLVETCLRIPTYTLAHGGADRAVERAAFRRDLPRQILERQSKGGTIRYFNQVLVRNLPFIRELLLDGNLIREGLLERSALEATLARGQMIAAERVSGLVNCVVAEAWVRRWKIDRARAAA